MTTEKETKKMMTVKEIISSRLKAREERDKGIMQFYDELIKESLQSIDDAVFLKGENQIDLILKQDKNGDRWVSALLNEETLFESVKYKEPSRGFIAIGKLFDGEEGLKKVEPFGEDGEITGWRFFFIAK